MESVRSIDRLKTQTRIHIPPDTSRLRTRFGFFPNKITPIKILVDLKKTFEVKMDKRKRYAKSEHDGKDSDIQTKRSTTKGLRLTRR